MLSSSLPLRSKESLTGRFMVKPLVTVQSRCKVLPPSHVLVEIRWVSYFQSKDRPQAW